MERIDAWLESRLGPGWPGGAAPKCGYGPGYIGLAGLLLALAAGEKWALVRLAQTAGKPQARVTNLRRFLWGKLLLWLAALPAAAILGGIFFFLPLGKPVFNLIYVGFIGGYGLVLFALYQRGKMPGVQGRALARQQGERQRAGA